MNCEDNISSLQLCLNSQIRDFGNYCKNFSIHNEEDDELIILEKLNRVDQTCRALDVFGYPVVNLKERLILAFLNKQLAEEILLSEQDDLKETVIFNIDKIKDDKNNVIRIRWEVILSIYEKWNIKNTNRRYL